VSSRMGGCEVIGHRPLADGDQAACSGSSPGAASDGMKECLMANLRDM
jgi:hypothetical protein